MTIPQTGEPSSRTTFDLAHIFPQGVDEDEFRQFRQHDLPAGVTVIGLIHGRPKETGQPPLAGDRSMGGKKSRKALDQGIERAQVAAEVTAHEVTALRTPGRLVQHMRHRQRMADGSSIKIKVGFAAHARG